MTEFQDHLQRTTTHFIVLITEHNDTNAAHWLRLAAEEYKNAPPKTDEEKLEKLCIMELSETIFVFVHPFNARDCVAENTQHLNVVSPASYFEVAMFSIKGKHPDSIDLAVLVVHNRNYRDGKFPQSVLQYLSKMINRCGARVLTGSFGILGKHPIERLCGVLPTATPTPFYNTFKDRNGTLVAFPLYTICFGKAGNCTWPEDAQSWSTGEAIEREVCPLFRELSECIPYWQSFTPSQADVADCCDTEWGKLKTKNLILDKHVPGTHSVVIWSGTSVSGAQCRRNRNNKRLVEWLDEKKAARACKPVVTGKAITNKGGKGVKGSAPRGGAAKGSSKPKGWSKDSRKVQAAQSKSAPPRNSDAVPIGAGLTPHRQPLDRRKTTLPLIS